MPPEPTTEQSSSVNGEATRAMRELGFSESECTIYLDILRRPEGEAIESVLAHSRIPQAMTEEAIRSLVDKGLVRIASNRLEAAEPKTFVLKMREEKRLELSHRLETLNETGSRLLSILEPWYWEARLGIKPEDLLEPLPTLDEMELRTIRILANASRGVLISAETFGWFYKIREEVGRGIERGVRFRVLMKVKDEDIGLRASELENMGISVRQPPEDWYPVRGTLGDERELVFLIWAQREGKGDHGKFFRPHYSRNPGMIRIFADAFERRWAAATQI